MRKNNCTELHILNGDYALTHWQKCGFPAESLVWRETYLEGPLPETDDLDHFRKVRTVFLKQFDELADIDADKLYQYLQKLDNSLLNLPGTARLVLWFDSCIFDQTLLMRILYVLHLRKNDFPSIALYCCEGDCLELRDFQDAEKHLVYLDHQDLQTGAKAWQLYQRKDAAGMIHLAEQGDFKHFPAMKKALFRCAEDVPDSEGLTRTQRQILQVIANGAGSFVEIFTALDPFEEYPFLGDTACKRHLDHLIDKGLIDCQNGRYFRI